MEDSVLDSIETKFAWLGKLLLERKEFEAVNRFIEASKYYKENLSNTTYLRLLSNNVDHYNIKNEAFEQIRIISNKLKVEEFLDFFKSSILSQNH